jgi:hypothetical protein
MSKIYTVCVSMVIRKSYTVKAEDEDEAVELLMESGIVSSEHERDREQYYNEDYEAKEACPTTTRIDVG